MTGLERDNPEPQSGALPTELHSPHGEIHGTSDRIRTCDLRIRNPLLYPAELRTQPKSLYDNRAKLAIDF